MQKKKRKLCVKEMGHKQISKREKGKKRVRACVFT